MYTKINIKSKKIGFVLLTIGTLLLSQPLTAQQVLTTIADRQRQQTTAYQVSPLSTAGNYQSVGKAVATEHKEQWSSAVSDHMTTHSRYASNVLQPGEVTTLSSPAIRRVIGGGGNPGENPYPDETPVGDTPFLLLALLSIGYLLSRKRTIGC